MNDLKGCPFHKAGACDFMVQTDRSVASNDPPYRVIADCGCSGPHADSKAEAIAAWNTRDEAREREIWEASRQCYAGDYEWSTVDAWKNAKS